MTSEERQRARLPIWLGVAGLIPFILGAVMVFAAPVLWQALAIKAFVFYGAIILSFLGGIHWGVAMSLDRSGTRDFNTRLLAGTAPSLLAWPALLLDYQHAALVLMVGFLLMRLYERQRDSTERLPAWYQQLRSPLTAVAIVCHLAVLVRLMLP